MKSFAPKILANPEIPVSTGWLLGACMEARGKQDLWLRQKPEILKALREQAIIQSAESSNRIEGVTVDAKRLRPIVLGSAKPRDRSEEEVVGYRRALDWIFTRKNPVRVDPRIVLRLHGMSQSGFSGDAGKWKSKDNEIVEILPNGERRIRFRPTPARATPRAVEQLCLAYEEVCQQEKLPPLLAIASFVFDFLCIHPFRDGNGRVSRLLTTLLLGEHRFAVCRYISIERLIEESKEDYYAVLARCSKGWLEGRHDLVPWWNYFLAIVKRAYAELEERVEAAGSVPGKSELVRQTILGETEPFSLAELQAKCPQVSVQLLKKVLARIKEEGLVRLSGRGRGARWTVQPSR